jgi:hypothetical protein
MKRLLLLRHTQARELFSVLNIVATGGPPRHAWEG